MIWAPSPVKYPRHCSYRSVEKAMWCSPGPFSWRKRALGGRPRNRLDQLDLHVSAEAADADAQSAGQDILFIEKADSKGLPLSVAF